MAAAGDATLNREAIELYRRWGELADVTFVDLFRREHDRTDDTAKSWKVFSENLSG